MSVLADAGAIYALADPDDAWHTRVTAWWTGQPRSILIPATVLPPAAFLLAARVGSEAEEAFIRSLANDEVAVEPVGPGDLRRAADLMVAYDDLPLSFVDASIVAMAERLRITTLLTTRRRHFGVVRPRHVESFMLAP